MLRGLFISSKGSGDAPALDPAAGDTGGAVDIGQGSNTVISQIAADALALSFAYPVRTPSAAERAARELGIAHTPETFDYNPLA